MYSYELYLELNEINHHIAQIRRPHINDFAYYIPVLKLISVEIETKLNV